MTVHVRPAAARVTTAAAMLMIALSTWAARAALIHIIPAVAALVVLSFAATMAAASPIAGVLRLVRSSVHLRSCPCFC